MKTSLIVLAAVCSLVGPASAAATALNMAKSNGRDFDDSGAFVAFGEGTQYASTWAQYGGHGYFASPDVLSSSYYYQVPANLTFTTPATDAAVGKFPGTALILSKSTSVLNVMSHGAAVLDFTLLQLKGCKVYSNVKNMEPVPRAQSQTTIDGQFEVRSGTVTLDPKSCLNVGFTLRGELIVAAGAVLKVNGPVGARVSRPHFFSLELPGNNSAAAGSIEVNTNAVLSVGANGLPNVANVTVRQGSAAGRSQAATIRADSPTTACDVSNLAFQPYSALEVPVDPATGASGVLRVTCALAVTGPVDVYLSASSLTERTYPVLTLGKSATGSLTASDFAFAGFVDYPGFRPESARFTVAANGQGEQTLYVTVRPLVKAVLDSTAGNSQKVAYFCQNTNAAAWADAALPHGGADYTSGDIQNLRFPLAPSAHYVFPGESLVIGPNCSLWEASRSFTCSNLVLRANAKYYMWNANAFELKGKVTVCPDDPNGVAYIYNYQTRVETISAALAGQGLLCLWGNENSADPTGPITLAGDNSGFVGKIDLRLTKNTDRGYPTETEGKYVIVNVSQANQLGGALDAFAFDALAIRNYAQLRVTDDVTLAKAGNRGVYADAVGRILVAEGKTFAAEPGLTLRGELWKEGPGLLALGGSARFGNDGASEPTANKNVLRVKAGAFKPLSAACLDGVAATFAAGTRLVYDIVPVESELADKGVVQSRSLSALTLEGETIDVEFAGEKSSLPAGGAEVGLFTGPETACAAFADKLRLTRRRGLSIRLLPQRDNGDGTFTVRAAVDLSGICVIVR